MSPTAGIGAGRSAGWPWVPMLRRGAAAGRGRSSVAGGRVPRREYRLTEGTSNKFWAIEVDGTTHSVQFGRMGTAGQTQTKQFKAPEEAQRAYEKLVREKVKKGYRRVVSGDEPPAG